MAKELLFPARKFLRLLDYMERIGLDSAAMLQAINVRADQLQAMSADDGLPGSFYSRMYKNAVGQMQTLKRPIPWGAGVGSDAFELMCHSIIGCKTLGEALLRAQRYDKMLYPMIGYRARLVLAEPLAELHYHVHVDPDGSVFTPEDWDRSEYAETVAHASGLLIWYGLCGWLIGRSLDLESVHIAGPPVSDAYGASLREVFHCVVEFWGAGK